MTVPLFCHKMADLHRVNIGHAHPRPLEDLARLIILTKTIIVLEP